MCNEYRLRQPLDRIVEEFSALKLPLRFFGDAAPNLEARDSIRPTDPAPVVTGREGGAELRQLPWGFPRPRGGPIINFRSENRRFPEGRCLVPADGFYEFTGTTRPKSKWLFESGDLFCIAGLVREDRFTLLTTAPGPDIAPYHDRQIVILPREAWAAWLNGPVEALPALGPSPAGTLQVTQIR